MGRKKKGLRPITDRYEVNENGCWIWKMALMKNSGYGRMFTNGAKVMAHRYVYELHKGAIPPGFSLDHLCRVTSCVNPDHLEPVSHAENCRRGAATKLSREQVAELRALKSKGVSSKVLAERFSVHPCHVWHVAKGRVWN